MLIFRHSHNREGLNTVLEEGVLGYLPHGHYYSRKVLRNNDRFNAKKGPIIVKMLYEMPVKFIYSAYDSVATKKLQ